MDVVLGEAGPYERSAAHPRLADPATRAALRRELLEAGRVRVDDALDPGLAAEIVRIVSALPFALSHLRDEGARCFYQRCDLAVPFVTDVQVPDAIYRLARFFAFDLPELAGAVAGRPFAPGSETEPIVLRRFQRGCYLEPGAGMPEGALEAVLGLTGPRWPEAWGGWLEASGTATPPGPEALVLSSRPLGVPLVLKNVEHFSIARTLVPAAAGGKA